MPAYLLAGPYIRWLRHLPCVQADFNYKIAVEIKPTVILGSPLYYVSRQITGADEPDDWVLGEMLRCAAWRPSAWRLSTALCSNAHARCMSMRSIH